jgi:hypothetical protein
VRWIGEPTHNTAGDAHFSTVWRRKKGPLWDDDNWKPKLVSVDAIVFKFGASYKKTVKKVLAHLAEHGMP